jgi:hypothetical protein
MGNWYTVPEGQMLRKGETGHDLIIDSETGDSRHLIVLSAVALLSV